MKPRQAILYSTGATACFHLAYGAGQGWLIFGYVFCLVQLARVTAWRSALGFGFLAGALCVVPQAWFFSGIFGLAAPLLWSILASWIGLFVVLASQARQRLPPAVAALLIPVLWLSLEYFRSELYPLRFSWLNIGYAPHLPGAALLLGGLGVYGTGLFAVALCTHRLSAMLLLAAALLHTVSRPETPRSLLVAGVQWEFPVPGEVIHALDTLLAKYPAAPLLVMSELTFRDSPPAEVMDWCRAHGKYLIAGGKLPTEAGAGWYNTAFVISPQGRIVFTQGKTRPVQFFDDGLPALAQHVWPSPWGPLGIGICYDLSYTRVTDELIRQGARALIIPTMDVEEWGRHEHELHALVAPARAREYRIPIFRLASSGISQALAGDGHELARAPFPGEGALLGAELLLVPPSQPLDRSPGWLAALLALAFAIERAWEKGRRRLAV